MSFPYRKDHVPELDGLRAVAVVLVLWQHVPLLVLPRLVRALIPAALEGTWLLQLDNIRNYVQPGYLGVDIFFVLSGFLITRILLVDKQRGLPLRYFLARRLLRIFPIYYLTLIVVWVVWGGPELPWCAAYLANFWFPFHESGGPLQHTWSLSVEEHFYLVWPPVVYLCSYAVSRRVVLFGLLPLAVASAAYVAWLWDPEAYVFILELTQQATPFRAGSLAMGALLAYSERHLRGHSLRTVLAATVVGAVGYAVFLSTLRLHSTGHSDWIPFAWLVGIGLVSTSIVTLVIGTEGSRNPLSALLRSSPARYVGRISYGLYLYHHPINYALGLYEGERGEVSLGRGVLAVVLTFAAASVSFHVLERPILNVARHFRARSSEG